MIPYVLGHEESDNHETVLPLVAGVEHMRNGYSIIAHMPLAKTHVEAALQRRKRSLRDEKNEQESTGDTISVH